YDSIDAAYQYLLADGSGTSADSGTSGGGGGSERIAAVVVLTDGADTDSKLPLPQLLNRIRSDSEKRSIRVFTIGYGKDAKEDVLRQIADVTRAKYYKGDPKNIREVFKDIATFF